MFSNRPRTTRPFRAPRSPKATKPTMVFTGVKLALDFDRYMRNVWLAPGVTDLTQLVAILYYQDGRLLVVPAKPEDKDSHQVFGKQRFNRGDRVVWTAPNSNLCIYSTLLADVTVAATKYFTPGTIALLAQGRQIGASFLDMLVPYHETITNFCDSILGLFERGCSAKTCTCPGVCQHPPILDIDAVEGDYAKMQKLLTYIERGATVGEREAAVRRVETQVGKLYAKIQESLGAR